MSRLDRRLAALSPEKRRLLELRMKKAGLSRPGRDSEASTSAPRRRSGPAPLSFGQQRLWFIHYMAPESPSYNIPFAGRLHGSLEPQLLLRGLAEVVRRQEVLHTRFPEIDGSPVQVVEPGAVVSMPLVDLAALPSEVRERELVRRLDEHPKPPFDLARGPVWRVHLVRMAAEDHALLVTMHHIVTDAWSMAVLFRELPACYDALHEGRPLPPAPAVQVADHAIRQRETFQGEHLERELDFWRTQLDGAPTVVDLPFDRPRPAAQTLAGRRWPVAVPQGVVEKLRALDERLGATTFMALLAIFDALVYRYTGQDDLLMGSPFATREDESTHPLIGFFINIAVLRLRLGGRPGFRELLERSRESTLATLAHQELPFEKLLEVTELERDPSRPPLVQLYLVLQNVHIPRPDFAEIEVPWVQQTDTRSARVDLTFGLWEETGLQGWFEYNVDLFDRTTVARMGAHLNTLLAAAVEDPERPIDDLALLPAAERHQLVAESEPPTWGDDELLHRRFEGWAARTPDAVAVRDGEMAVGYGELEARSNRLAHHLRRRGVAAERRVGLELEGALDQVTAILAVWKAGGAYVPIDPRHPDERRRFLLADAGVSVLLGPAELAADLGDEPDTAPEVSLDGDRIEADHAAYLIHTSGSTGKPKGVVVTHGHAARLVRAVAARFDFGPHDVRSFFHSYAFDVSVWEIWGALALGGRLVGVPYEVRRSPRDVLALLAEEAVTVLAQTPSAFRQLTAAEPEAAEVLAVRLAALAGEALEPSDVAPWLGRGVEFVNLYGITETTVYTTWRAFRGGETRSLIGAALAHLELHVLDARLEPAPIGVPGEIVIGGGGLARGYHGRPGLTADRFVAHPLAGPGRPGERLYKSGDLARRLADGDVEYLGRLDRQVKLRGFRLEPGEVEATLREHPEIADAVVTLRPGPSADAAQRLVAWVEAPAPPADWRSFLGERLPAHMVPALLVTLDALPVTPSGKVDRTALDRRALPAAHDAQHDAGFAAPAKGTEALLAGIWQELLGVGRVGADDDFFALGGDSILAIRMISRAAVAGVRIEPPAFFARPTVATLAAVAEVTRPEEGAGALEGEVALMPIQHWFFELGPAEPHHWNLAFLLELERCDPDHLKEAVRALLEHHDALRARFEDDDGIWHQYVAAPDVSTPEGEVPYRHLDLGDLAEAERIHALEREASRVQGSLDLGAGSLLRAVSFDLGSSGARLLLVVHHLVIDGVSWTILLEDLATALAQLERGEAVTLPPRTASVRTWAEALASWARSHEARRELETWRAMAPSRPLPRDLEGEGPGLEGDAETVEVALDAELTAALLTEVPEAYRTRIDEVLVAALAETLTPWTEERVLTFDLEGHGRQLPCADDGEAPDVSRTVGWFTSMYPVALDLQGAWEPGEVIQAVKEAMRRVPGGAVGYGALRYLGGAEAAMALGGSEREVVFNYLGQLDASLGASSPLRLATESHGALRSPRALRGHLLEVTAWILDGRLRLAWASSSRVHRRSTLEKLADIYLEALEDLIEHCRSPEAGGVSPSDFPEATLDQAQLDKLMATLGSGGPVGGMPGG